MIKKLVTCGILASVAIVVSMLERFVPIQALIPLPGLKLGLANCIILFALMKLDFKSALSILSIKSLIVSLLFTGLTSFVYSITGGVLALVGMMLLCRYKNSFSVLGISVAGAALFNIGQIIAASAMLANVYIFMYLPFLLIASVITGLLTGSITNVLLKNINIQVN